MKTMIKTLMSVMLVAVFLIVPMIGGISSMADSATENDILDIDSKLPVVHIRTNNGKNPGRDGRTPEPADCLCRTERGPCEPDGCYQAYAGAF
ncbi:MAG: hypothetical protein IKB23_02795 [Clostridia bacterium]|nr:hypothetical protein [Clostridia bacterium]